VHVRRALASACAHIEILLGAARLGSSHFVISPYDRVTFVTFCWFCLPSIMRRSLRFCLDHRGQ
jgi:hypothetical protein